MPLVQAKLIDGVSSHAPMHEMIRKHTDAMVSFEGEKMRGVTWVVIQEVNSGSWGLGVNALSTGDNKAGRLVDDERRVGMLRVCPLSRPRVAHPACPIVTLCGEMTRSCRALSR